MPIATELNIDTSATAEQMADAMFGDGVSVVSATYSGDAVASGTYTGGTATLGELSPSDTGVILSTGQAQSITNDSGTTDTNTSDSTGVDNAGGIDGDADLNAVSGQSTFDGAFLEAVFIPVGDTLTMQLVFSSEEYLDYVNSGVNDAIGVWVNGVYVPLELSDGTTTDVTIDTINNTSNENLYVDNPVADDFYNTEMDGSTVVLSLTAPVNPGVENDIRIGIADGGDSSYDSNLLIMGNSVQTVSLANNDMFVQGPNSTVTHNILANDTNTDGNAVSVTHINNQAVNPGDTVTLGTGEQITLNADGTITVQTDGDIGANTFTYSTVDSAGNPATGYITIETSNTPPDFIVEGTAGADVIDAGYVGDPDGDMIDNLDHSDASNDDLVQAGGGADTVYGGAGSDTIFGEGGNDQLFGGDETDALYGGTGDDSLFGESGDDSLFGGDGADVLEGGTGDDSLDLGAGDGAADSVAMADGEGNDSVAGFEAPTDNGDGTYSGNDQLDVSGLTDASGNPVNVDDVVVTDTNGDGTGDAILTFPGGESITLTGVPVGEASSDAQLVAMGIPPATGNYIVEGGAGGDLIDSGYIGDPDGDMIDNNDAADGGNDDYVEAGAGDDTVLSGEGDDSVIADLGNDNVDAGAGNDTVRGGAGEDTILGGDGDDSIYGNEDGDSIEGGAGADSIYGETGDDYVSGGDGDDHLEGNEGADTIYGGAGNDWIRGSYGEDEIHGGEGDDYLWGGFNDDTFIIENNFGNDTIDAEGIDETDGDTLDLSGVTDDLTIDLTDVNPENGSFTDGSATATFNEIENIILGGGTDTLVLANFGGADEVIGFEAPTDNGDGTYSGNDQLDVSGLTDASGHPVSVEDVTVSDTNGDGTGDAILTFPGGESLTLTGVSVSEVESFDQLEAMGIPPATGDFIVEGTAGGDLIDDGYIGDPEGDRIENNDHSDGSNADSVEAGAGDDTIWSGEGDDTVRADDGDDLVFGGEGNDEIWGHSGSDTVFGEDGDDTINTRTAPGTGIPDEGYTDTHGTGLSYPSDPDPDNDRDSVDGGAGNDSILTGDDNDTVLGGDGDDTIDAGFDDDSVEGGAGADSIEGNEGNDTIHGGDGGDVIYGDVSPDNAGYAAFVPYDLPNDGSDDAPDNNADSLSGGAGDDTIYGQDDDDTLDGGAGDDLLDGGNDDDSLVGGEGADTLLGGGGEDIIQLGTGDSAEGGDGDDLFLVNDLGEAPGAITVTGGEGDETLGDTLDFQGLTHWDDITYTNTDPGVGGGLSGFATLGDGTTVNFSEIENVIICFAQGTRIATAGGLREVQDLRPGDLVVTRDHGLQPVRWAGKRTVPAQGRLAPIRFEAGVLGNERALTVSPQHRMLVRSGEASLLFGESEVLAAAKHLVNGGSIARVPGGEVTYVHILFDSHEIVYAEGAPSESFFPGDSGLDAVEDAAREELFGLFPELRSSAGNFSETARMCLRAHESRLLRVS